MNLSNKNIGGFYAVLFGIPFSLALSYIIFKPTLYIDLFQEIADFGTKGTSLFWGITYPLLHLIILFFAGRKINLTENKSVFEKASRFSFSVTLKIIAILSFIFVVNKILNGISTTVVPFASIIIFSIITLLFIIFTSSIVTFIISLLTIKFTQNKLQPKNNTH